MAADRVTINAGGRKFETTRTTLLASESHYFSALFGPTGTMLAGRPTKRRRTSSAGNPQGGTADEGGENEENEDDAPREIFVDRDPDRFADVLQYLRSLRLPSSAKSNISRLEDIAAEAEFFGLDNLEQACLEAIEKVKEAHKPPKPAVVPKAHVWTAIVARGRVVRVTLKEGEVLWIQSGTLAGDCRCSRYAESDEQKETREASEHPRFTAAGVYLNTCQVGDTGDFQLQVFRQDLDNEGQNEHSLSLDAWWVTIKHLALDANEGSTSILHIDLTHDIRVCLNADSDGEVELKSVGSADWHLTGFIGLPDTIPALRGGAAPSSEPARRRAFFQMNGSGQGTLEVQEVGGQATGNDCCVM